MEPDLIPYQAVRVPPGRRALALAPHPDDEVIGCGGTLAALAAAAVPLHVVVASGGERGTADASTDAGLVSARCAESIAAAGVLGYPEPEFWGLPDRGLRYGEALIARVRAAIEAFDADLVLAPSMYEVHPDHRALAFATLEALRRLGGERRIALYEVGAAVHPNLLVDITPYLERKERAMRCFASQLAVEPYHEYVRGLNRWRAYTLGPAVQAAEALMLIEAARLDAPQWPLVEPHWVQERRADPFGAQGSDASRISIVVRGTDLEPGSPLVESLALQTWQGGQGAEIVPMGLAGVERCGAMPVRAPRVAQREVAAGDLAAALSRCEGDAVLVIDRPVVMKPDALATMATALEASPLAPAAVASVSWIDGEGRELAVPPDAPAPLAAFLLARKPLVRWSASAAAIDASALRAYAAGLTDTVAARCTIAVPAREPQSGGHPQTTRPAAAAIESLRERQIGNLVDALEAEIARHAETRQALQRAGAQSEHLARERARLGERVAQLESGAEALRTELSRLQDEQARLLGSRSWRITRPLRALAAWGRRLTGGGP